MDIANRGGDELIARNHVARLFSAVILVGCLVSPIAAHAETPSGTVLPETIAAGTLTLAGSPYVMESTVTCAGMVTIEPGVTIYGQGNTFVSNTELRAWATRQHPVTFDHVRITSGATCRLTFSLCKFVGGAVSPRDGAPTSGSLELDECYLSGVAEDILVPDTLSGRMVMNTLVDCGKVDIGVTGGRAFSVCYNLFVGDFVTALECRNAPGNSNVSLYNNTFAPTSGTDSVLKLTPGNAGAKLNASGNYWHRCDSSSLSSRVFDHGDDPTCATTITVEPALSAPDSVTPSLSLFGGPRVLCYPASSYEGTASIRMDVVSSAPGTPKLYWTLDDVSSTVATTSLEFQVATPGVHVIEYWAIDALGVEGLHDVAYFTVSYPTKIPALSAPMTISYNALATLRGRLVAPPGSGAGRTVQLRTSTNGTSFGTPIASALTDASGSFVFTTKPRSKTWYRVDFEGVPGLESTSSACVVVLPRVSLSTPRCATTMRVRKGYTVSGVIKPAHASGTGAVKLLCYRREKQSDGAHKWILRRTFSAKLVKYSGYSWYIAAIRLPYEGSWSIRAYHTDTAHAASYSAGKAVTAN